jgi:hypothetical protein
MGAAKKRRQNQTRFDRFKHRVTCDFYVEGQKSSAIVTDLSASGLYVRTSHLPEPGTTVRLVLRAEGGDIEIQAKVAREHRMSRHHTTGTPTGVGVQILSAPEAYFQLLTELGSE